MSEGICNKGEWCPAWWNGPSPDAPAESSTCGLLHKAFYKDNPMPLSCPFKHPLKAVSENPDKVLVAVPKEVDLLVDFTPRTCCEGCIRLPCRNYGEDGRLKHGLGVMPDSRDRPGCYRPSCCEGCARDECLCGGNREEKEGERPHCYTESDTLDLEGEKNNGT